MAKFKDLPQGDLTGYYRFLNELGDRFHASHHLVMRMAQFLVLLQGKRLESLPRERIETQVGIMIMMMIMMIMMIMMMMIMIMMTMMMGR